MSFSIATLLTIAIISRPITCNFDCICHYDVEQAVHSKPDPVSTPLGFMYEFDCKAIDAAQSHPEWWTIFFEHMTGYVPMGDKIIEQTCPGDIQPDDILTTKQAPQQSMYQSTIFSTPQSTVTETLYSKQTGSYSTPPRTKSYLSTTSSTVSRSNKISTSRSPLSSILSSPQASITGTLYHQHTGSYSTSIRTKSYSSPISSTSAVSRYTKISTPRSFLSTILSSPQNFVTGNLYHQNTSSSSTSPKPRSYFTTTPSTALSRSAKVSTSVLLLSTVNSTSLTGNSSSSLKTILPFSKSSTSSAQTIVESKTRSTPGILFNITTSSGTKAENAANGTTVPSILFNVTSSVPTKAVVASNMTTISSVLFNVTSTLPTKTVVASGRTHISLVLSNVTSTFPTKTVVALSETSIPSILQNVTSRLPTKPLTVVVSNRTTLPPIHFKETTRSSTKMIVTPQTTVLPTNLFNTTTSSRSGNTTKSSTTAIPSNHFNTTTDLSSKINIPSKMATTPPFLFNTTMHLSSKTRITDNTHHTVLTSSAFVTSRNVNTKVFNEMTSTTKRESNISIKVNWTTAPTQSETSKPSIPSAITTSAVLVTLVQLNTGVSTNRMPTSSGQNSSTTNEVSYSSTSKTRESSLTVTNKVYSTASTTPTVIRSTTDKWSVEMCPYLMLSRNKYNGSLDHPYPLVRRVGQHCYEFNAKLDNWYSARSICRQKGGDLVVLDTENTQITLLSMLKELQFDGEVWIGLNDIDMEGIWTWVNGARYPYEHWDSLSNGDPAYDVRRNCAVMNTVTGQWKKTVCRGFLLEMPRHYFICQYSI